MDISIIIPVFNEEKNIPLLCTRLCQLMESLNKEYEIIIVNDGSTDSSFSVMRTQMSSFKNIQVIDLEKNYGQTLAAYTGICHARGKYILTMDADLQYDVKEIPRVLRALEDADVVIGCRTNRIKCDGIVKFLSSKIANYIRNNVLGVRITDAGCFLRGYKKECIKDLIADKNLNIFKISQVFTVPILAILGYKVNEIEILGCKRKYGRSKYNIHNRLFKELINLLAVKWMQKNILEPKISCRIYK